MKKNIMILLIIFIMFITVNVEAKSNIITNSLSIAANESCEGYFGSASDSESLMHFLKYDIFVPIKYAVPIILLILTSIDFAKVVFDGVKDSMSKAKKNFAKRAIIAIIIFFIPDILELIMTVVDDSVIRDCISKF